jgi:hypothetical protein
MTLAITANIILVTIAFTAVIALIGWAIRTSAPQRTPLAAPAARARRSRVDHGVARGAALQQL